MIRAYFLLLLYPATIFAAKVESVTVSLDYTDGDTSKRVLHSDVPVEIPDRGKISTGVNGQARVTLKDGTRFDLGPSTTIDLQATAPGESRSFSSLLYGKLKALIPKQTSSQGWGMKVGSAAMGVRGTEFIVEKEPQEGKFLVCTTEGAVAISTQKQKEILVHAGEGVVVNDDGSAEEPLPMDRTQIAWWQTRSNEDTVTNWRWDGSPQATSIDPAALYSGHLRLIPDIGIWVRSLYFKNETILRDFVTGRLKLGATLAASSKFALYSDIRLIAKNGHTNPEPGFFNFHQGFALFKPSTAHTFVLGRQEWDFGTGLIIGKDPWRPVTRTQDGALYITRTKSARLNFFTATLGDRVNSIRMEDWMSGIFMEFADSPLDMHFVWMKRNGAREFYSFNLGGHAKVPFSKTFFWENELSLQYRMESLKDRYGYLGNFTLGQQNDHVVLPYTLKLNFLVARRYEQVFPDSHRFLGLISSIPKISHVRKYSVSSEIRPQIFKRSYSIGVEGSLFDEKIGKEVDLLIGARPLANFTYRIGLGKFWGTGTTEKLMFLLLDLEI